MNPKITKLKAEREKNTAKISALQKRNKEIDGSITEMENLEIVGSVRESGLTAEKLAELIASLKNKPVNTGNYTEMEDSNEEN